MDEYEWHCIYKHCYDRVMEEFECKYIHYRESINHAFCNNCGFYMTETEKNYYSEHRKLIYFHMIFYFGKIPYHKVFNVAYVIKNLYKYKTSSGYDCTIMDDSHYDRISSLFI